MRKLGIILSLACVTSAADKVPIDQAQYDALALYWHAGEYARALLGCPETVETIRMPRDCRTTAGKVNAQELRELRMLAKRMLSLRD
jgi:hypothetical protein